MVLFWGRMDLLLLTLWIVPWSLAQRSNPRLRLSHKELWNLNRTWVFHSPQLILGPGSMLLDEYQERLFLGGPDTLYSLSLERVTANHREIHWPSTVSQVDECLMQGRGKAECINHIKVLHHFNKTHLLACGTGAFAPVCAYIRVGHRMEDTLFKLEDHHIESGRGRCPFHPDSPTVSSFSRGQLYIGLYTDYWENDGAVCRLGNSSYTRTELDDRQQLNEPKFVGSVVVPDNDDMDDDKVYFFFTEKALEDSGNHVVYTRIGRVCANDAGGQRMLVKKWTSFIKTRLVCSVPGSHGPDTHFDELVDVFVLKRKDEKNPEIFGLFSTTSSVFSGFAVCVYRMDDVRAAFGGPYAHREHPEHRWTAFDGRVPFPRPGSCASKVNGGMFQSSRDYPDEVLRFVRDHPQMYRSIHPAHRRPILVRTDGEWRFTQIAVDRVEAQDGHYDVLFVGTDNAVVLKVMSIYNAETDTIEEVLLEELHVFKVPVPVTEILISAKRQQLYVGSELGVAQVRFHQCDLYGSACADCCLARDPYCAWDGVTCSRYYPNGLYTKRRFRRQDVRHGDAVQQCNGERLEKADEKVVYGVESNSTLLECNPRSPQAKAMWFVRRGADRMEVKEDDRTVRTAHGLLFLRLRREDSGTYLCQTVERGFVHTAVQVTLEVLEEERVGETFRRGPCSSPGLHPGGSTPKLWYKEFLQLVDSSGLLWAEEYCEKLWCYGGGGRRKKPRWRYSQAQEKRGRAPSDPRRVPRRAPDT